MAKSFAILSALLVAAGLLGVGLPPQAATAQQGPPAETETPSLHLTYDGVLPAPRLPRTDKAAAQDAAPALLAPEYASWSRLVFQSARNDRDWEVYGALGDGSNQTALSNNVNMDMHPRLNRGATRVVFASNRRDDNYEIYAMVADGGGQTRLTTNEEDDVYPAWSPDGSRIAFQAYRDGQAEIYAMNANGSGQTRLTNHHDYDGQPAWSPDGTKIAFVREDSGQYRIWVMNADGSNPVQLSGQAYSENPAWSPDGSQIAYDADADDDGWQEIWLMDAAGGNQRLVYEPPEEDTDAWVRSWSPDGRYIAFTRISFVQYDGEWYWTPAYLDAWDSTGGNVIRLSSNGEDWYPDWQPIEQPAPTSSVRPLPAQSPGPFTVSWSGTSTGPAGIASYDVQVRDGPSGAWMDWQMASTAQSAAYPGRGGHTYYFRSRARDGAGYVEAWPADPDAFTTVEALPPQTAVAALPAYSRRDATIRWGGSDPGGSGIRSYDVQVRMGAGAWTNWLTGTTDTSGTFPGTVGEEYDFRVRGVDNAGNLEAWPADAAADASTTYYAWQLTGRLTDNRGVAIGRAALSIAPAPLLAVQTDAHGDYRAYLAADGDHTVAVNRAGYGTLAPPAFAIVQEQVLDLYLPPVQDLATNGGFEAGAPLPAGWTMGGPDDAIAISADAHTGARALMLGRTCAYPCLSAPERLPADSASDMASDSQGNLYLVYPGIAEGKPMVGLIMRRPGGSWSAPELLGSLDSSSWASGVAVDGHDVVHVVWTQDDGLYYRWRAPGAQWSAAQHLVESHGDPMDVAADHLGGVHVIYSDRAGTGHEIRYLERLPSGNWQAPVALESDGYLGPGIAVGPDASVHFIYQHHTYGEEGIFYRWRPHGGAILPSERLWTGFGYTVYQQDLAVGSDGIVHAAFYWAWHNYYSNRLPGGSWTAPEPVSDAGPPAIAVDAAGAVHFVGLNGYGPYSLCYRSRSPDGTWRAPVTLGAGYTNGSALAIDPEGEVHLAGYLMDPTPGGYYWTSLAAAASDAFTVTASQQVTIPADMHRPTVAADYALRGQGSPLSIRVGNAISATEVFSATAASGWQLAYADLTPWAGQQVTVTFQLQQVAGAPYARVRLDDVTLGDWPTPVVLAANPPRVEPWTATPIVISGMNFLATPAVRIGSLEAEGVDQVNENTLHAIVPAKLGPGIHDLWVTNPGGSASVLAGAFRSGQQRYFPVIERR